MTTPITRPADAATESTDPGPRWTRRGLRYVAAAALAATAAFGVGAVNPSQASASPWDPHVALTGRVSCPAFGGPRQKVDWVWMQADNGESGFASLGSGSLTRQYRKDFYRVPYGRSTKVTVRFGCSVIGGGTRTVYVSRPRIGSYTTINIA